MEKSRVRVRVITKTLKILLTAPQPRLVIMSLSKGAAHTLYNGPIDKGSIIQRAGCLIS